MLSSISWQHYLTAIIILIAIYYSYIFLRYYQAELQRLFNRTQTAVTVIIPTPANGFQVMGPAKPDYGMSVMEADELPVAESTPDEPETNPEQHQRLVDPPVTPDILKELVSQAGQLIEACKEVDNKPEFLTLLGILLGPYKRFQEELDVQPALKNILDLSEKTLRFPVSMKELQNAWNN